MRRLSACSLTLSALVLNVMQFEPTASGHLSAVRQDEGLPCYVVVSNEARGDDERREIRIVMSKDDVNQANFVKLHRHFTGLYAHVDHLRVQVHTSLNFTLGNYTTVEDMERLQAGLPTKPKVWEKDAQGILMRTGEVEEFGYKGEGGEMTDMKYFLIKGEDPDCHNCKRLDDEIRGQVITGMADPRKTQDRRVPCYFAFGNSTKDGQRIIGVLINAEDGSEANLRALLNNFSRQYAKPGPLVVKVYTNLKQLNDFVGLILGDYSVPTMREYFVAAMFRDSGNEVIRYRLPNEKAITVVVRGVDIFPDL